MSKRNLIVFDVPSNLGLRPPEEGAVPGCYKLPWALRDLKLLEVIDADDGGSVVPPRYRSQWSPGDGDRNADAIADYSIRLANRLDSLVLAYRTVLVLGGDCSILIGNMDELASTKISVTTSQTVLESRSDQVAESVLATVGRQTRGFWIHLDLDVIDAAEMPAVDCPEANGMPFSTATTLLGQLLASPKCVGIEVTIYDPDLDPSGVCARHIVESLTQAFSIASGTGGAARP